MQIDEQAFTEDMAPMPREPENNQDGELFLSWLSEMEWDKHGGLSKAAEALGKSTMQIARYRDGAHLSRDTLLAMSALAEDLEPWGDVEEVFAFKLSFGRAKSKKTS